MLFLLSHLRVVLHLQHLFVFGLQAREPAFHFGIELFALQAELLLKPVVCLLLQLNLVISVLLNVLLLLLV